MSRCSCTHRVDEHGDACGVPNCGCDLSKAVLMAGESVAELPDLFAEGLGVQDQAVMLV